ncbi:3-deoxy-D-arabino-heptulosonate 7-phosphate synthase [Achromobacter kerstersii]|nr:3-deoxy-D-arabino-heptulosonate 7-phosphate synthase [Achromobacter kerstersii]
MPLPPRPALLDETLRIVARRYRVPPTPAVTPDAQNGHSATALALAIDQARQALAHGDTPRPEIERAFIDALAQLIRGAMREGQGDPAIQAMELRHRVATVREYASLSAGADADRREILAAANAIAHPAKLARMPRGLQADALADVQAAASSGSWTVLADAVQQLRDMPETMGDDPLARGCARLLDSAALTRLQRLDALAADARVRHYQSLWDRNGPRPGSATALRQGTDAQQRGAAVEALAAQALEVLAQRLNASETRTTKARAIDEGAIDERAPDEHASDEHATDERAADDRAANVTAPYRVVTSMRVPPSLPASADRAKSEWDAALLRQSDAIDAATATPAWDLCLLVEAKASVDAASTDLPRLLRGLQLLAHADSNTTYPFKTQQGIVPLRGESLRALPADGPGLADTVLYCCDAPADPSPRLLNAASRMQLLSAPASIAFASQLAQGLPADIETLHPVWHSLLTSPQWAGVLNQYPQLHQVRALMVHTDDLLDAAHTAHL